LTQGTLPISIDCNGNTAYKSVTEESKRPARILTTHTSYTKRLYQATIDRATLNLKRISTYKQKGYYQPIRDGFHKPSSNHRKFTRITVHHHKKAPTKHGDYNIWISSSLPPGCPSGRPSVDVDSSSSPFCPAAS
jgi:hypothetical protein